MLWRWLDKDCSGHNALRLLKAREYSAAANLMQQAPFETVLMCSCLNELSASPRASLRSGSFLGYFDTPVSSSSCNSLGSELRAVCWNGANIIPWGFDSEGLDQLAYYLTHHSLAANSFVGAASQVLPLWDRVCRHFSPPRDVRPRQLSMVYQGKTSEIVTPDSNVRAAQLSEYELVLPASIAMFIEEVGYDPAARGNTYSKRVRSLIERGCTFVKMGCDFRGNPRVEFKADVGAYAGGVAQIQGVWVLPELRGQGIAAPCMATVARTVQEKLRATVHLYVNDFNLPAVRTYEKAGFAHVGDYATIML